VQIVDRFGITYAVKSWPLGEGAVVYYVLAFGGNAVVARAALQVAKGCISEVLVYHQADRRRGIASALYRLIEVDVGRSRIWLRAVRAFWAAGRQVRSTLSS
jgi:hypothetical protein